MKINNCLILITSIILTLTGFGWIYKGTRAEIVVGVVCFIFAIVYALFFIENVIKKTINDAERKADMYRDEHMFENYEKQ